MNVSKKSRLATSLLGIFLGFVGVDLFYVGKVGLGILQIIIYTVSIIIAGIVGGLIGLTGVGVVLAGPIGFLLGMAGSAWSYVRWIKALCGKATDADGNIISEWTPE